MSNVALFGVGLLVTLIVAAAMSLLIWGALLDGREEDKARADRGLADAVVGPDADREEVAGRSLTRWATY